MKGVYRSFVCWSHTSDGLKYAEGRGFNLISLLSLSIARYFFYNCLTKVLDYIQRLLRLTPYTGHVLLFF